MDTHTKSEFGALFSAVGERAKDAGVFGDVVVNDQGVVCRALHSAEPADYRVFVEDNTIWVSLNMKDRWLSGSIESEFAHSGDKLHELIEDELDDLGIDDPVATFEHFRSPELEFVFRSKVPIQLDDPTATETAGTWLLAYEQCFRRLGDMDVTDEE